MTATTTDPQTVVDDFNATHGSVTWVRYWTGTRDDAPKYNLTDGKAWLLGGHTPVVRVRGESSCIALTHIDVIPGQPDDITDDSHDLPDLAGAAERVGEYIAANGDGIYDVIDGHPLYARDIEALRRAADMVWAAEQYKTELDRVRTNRDQVADSLSAVWDALGLKTASDGNAVDAIRKLTAELDRVRADLAAAHNHADGNATNVRGLQRVNHALANENGRLREQVFAQKPVIEAAQAWAEMCEDGGIAPDDCRKTEDALYDAIESHRLMDLALTTARDEAAVSR